MTTYALADESKRSDYVLAVALLRRGDAAAARRAIRALHLPGQSRLHMVKERASRQRAILSTIARTPGTVGIYRVGRGTNDRERRRRCLDRLVRDLARRGETHLVLELDETLVEPDRAALYAAARHARCQDRLRYTHARAATEPLLAIPDAVAWAWSQGGDWRRRTSGIVTLVVDA
ncbi:hypothetical protein [Cellulomonas sp. PS-H5]|uniref:hypothetical protein n=1 Tax=Cellulomonas sp. PS-H5 TaxID=2820400 RepID=UPI001C50258A|nr:hypothetical protein [Cellulomonas sp. PS-H5]MBW0253534.1 hypothetical protein [Cellulomonas sp. PS-H5]